MQKRGLMFSKRERFSAAEEASQSTGLVKLSGKRTGKRTTFWICTVLFLGILSGKRQKGRLGHMAVFRLLFFNVTIKSLFEESERSKWI